MSLPARPLILQILAVAFMLALSVVLQSQLAHRIAVYNARPDFLLVTLACAASLMGFPRSVWLGLIVGLLAAATAPGAYGATLASRTLTGAVAGRSRTLLVRNSVFSAPLIALSSTIACELIYNLIARNGHLRQLAVPLTGELLYNIVFAVPIYTIFRWCGVGSREQSPFAH